MDGPPCRDKGNTFDCFMVPFVEVGSRITELLCNYPTRYGNFKSRFLYTPLELFLFLVGIEGFFLETFKTSWRKLIFLEN